MSSSLETFKSARLKRINTKPDQLSPIKTKLPNQTFYLDTHKPQPAMDKFFKSQSKFKQKQTKQTLQPKVISTDVNQHRLQIPAKESYSLESRPPTKKPGVGFTPSNKTFLRLKQGTEHFHMEQTEDIKKKLTKNEKIFVEAGLLNEHFENLAPNLQSMKKAYDDERYRGDIRGLFKRIKEFEQKKRQENEKAHSLETHQQNKRQKAQGKKSASGKKRQKTKQAVNIVDDSSSQGTDSDGKNVPQIQRVKFRKPQQRTFLDFIHKSKLSPAPYQSVYSQAYIKKERELVNKMIETAKQRKEKNKPRENSAAKQKRKTMNYAESLFTKRFGFGQHGIVDLDLGHKQSLEQDDEKQIEKNFPLPKVNMAQQQRKVPAARENQTALTQRGLNESNLQQQRGAIGAQHRQSTQSFLKVGSLMRPKTQSQFKALKTQNSGSIDQRKSRNIGPWFNTEEQSDQETDMVSDTLIALDKAQKKGTNAALKDKTLPTTGLTQTIQPSTAQQTNRKLKFTTEDSVAIDSITDGTQSPMRSKETSIESRISQKLEPYKRMTRNQFIKKVANLKHKKLLDGLLDVQSSENISSDVNFQRPHNGQQTMQSTHSQRNITSFSTHPLVKLQSQAQSNEILLQNNQFEVSNENLSQTQTSVKTSHIQLKTNPELGPSRILTQQRIKENKLTYKEMQQHRDGHELTTHKKRQNAWLMEQIDSNKLIETLFESIQYDHKTDKRTCFEFIQHLINQIYGVDNQIVRNATERFPVNMPTNFDNKHPSLVGNQKQERSQGVLPKQYDLSGIETNEMKRQKVTKQLYIPNAENRSKLTTKQFIKNYVWYINRLLMSKSDPFIKAKSEAYLRNVDFQKLTKFANVFNRLNQDARHRVIGLIEKDPTLAGYEMNAMTKMNQLGAEYLQLDLEEIEIDKKIDRAYQIMPWIDQSESSKRKSIDDSELYPSVLPFLTSRSPERDRSDLDPSLRAHLRVDLYNAFTNDRRCYECNEQDIDRMISEEKRNVKALQMGDLLGNSNMQMNSLEKTTNLVKCLKVKQKLYGKRLEDLREQSRSVTPIYLDTPLE